MKTRVSIPKLERQQAYDERDVVKATFCQRLFDSLCCCFKYQQEEKQEERPKFVRERSMHPHENPERSEDSYNQSPSLAIMLNNSYSSTR